MAVRVTQVPLEALRLGNTPVVRVTQVAATVLRAGTPTARNTQDAVEVLRSNEVGFTVVMVIE